MAQRVSLLGVVAVMLICSMMCCHDGVYLYFLSDNKSLTDLGTFGFAAVTRNT
jgi:hypothetical protein